MESTAAGCNTRAVDAVVDETSVDKNGIVLGVARGRLSADQLHDRTAVHEQLVLRGGLTVSGDGSVGIFRNVAAVDDDGIPDRAARWNQISVGQVSPWENQGAPPPLQPQNRRSGRARRPAGSRPQLSSNAVPFSSGYVKVYLLESHARGNNKLFTARSGSLPAAGGLYTQAYDNQPIFSTSASPKAEQESSVEPGIISARSKVTVFSAMVAVSARTIRSAASVQPR